MILGIGDAAATAPSEGLRSKDPIPDLAGDTRRETLREPEPEDAKGVGRLVAVLERLKKLLEAEEEKRRR